jgi:hypothetical protein
MIAGLAPSRRGPPLSPGRIQDCSKAFRRPIRRPGRDPDPGGPRHPGGFRPHPETGSGSNLRLDELDPNLRKFGFNDFFDEIKFNLMIFRRS